MNCRVCVNGKIAKIATKVTFATTVTIKRRTRRTYIPDENCVKI